MIPALPEKKYFKIGEVADLVGVEPHVLRYWETQFPQVRPHKARSGHRLYRRREVETLLVIRELLHVQRFTIAGARQALRQPGGAQSLLPRFFDGPPALAPHGAASTTTEAPGPSSVRRADGPAESLVPVEVEALDADEMQDAFERDSAERNAKTGVVEVTVEGVDIPRARSVGLGSSLRPATLSGRKRALLEDALGEAREILAILDREDAWSRLLHV